MPQPIANNILTTPISGSIERAAMSLAIEGQDRDYGNNYSGLDWYSSITPIDGKYVIISKSIGTGLPTHWVTADDTDAELLYTVNRLPAVANNLTFTDTGSALDYLASSDRYIVLRSMPDNSDADALVLSVDPKNLSSYPQTGTTLYDLSGNGLNGSVNNSPIWEQGGYFVFDATDDNINFGNQTELNFTGDMSHEVWFWRNTNATSNLRLTAKGAGGTGTSQNGFSFFGSNTGMNWSLTLDGVRSILGTGITANQWNHIVGTVDKTTNTQKVYLNGIETNSQALVNTGSMVGTNSFYLGMFTGGSLVWDGKIGPARVYGKLLSSSDVKQNYYGGQSLQMV